MFLERLKSMHLVLNMFIFTRQDIGYIRENQPPSSHAAASTFKVCARKRGLATDIVHNMFGQIKMKIPQW